MRMKGVIFTLEATLSLLLAIGLVGTTYFADAPSYGKLYAYQVANDIAEVNVRSPAELALVKKFASGNPAELKAKLEQQMRALGAFCFKATANNREIRQSCFNEKHKTRAIRPVYDNGYYDFALELSW